MKMAYSREQGKEEMISYVTGMKCYEFPRNSVKFSIWGS